MNSVVLKTLLIEDVFFIIYADNYLNHYPQYFRLFFLYNSFNNLFLKFKLI